MEDNKVSLGCGTLILIALIVLIAGNAGAQKVTEEVQALRQETRELSESVEQLHAELAEIKLLLQAR